MTSWKGTSERQNGSVELADAAAALTTVMGRRPRTLRRVEGGWASYTFEVDGRFIARFPRNQSVARCTQTELDLLPRIGPLVDFAMPEVRWRGRRAGFPFFVYEAIPGRALTARDVDAHPGLADALASALHQLHGVELSVAAACGLAGSSTSPLGDPVDAWRHRYASLRAAAEQRVAPLLHAATAPLLEAAWNAFEPLLAFTPAVVHADLGTEHVLVSDGRFSGVIDWETACVGDPAIDFVGFHIALGPEWTGGLLDRYGSADPALRSRIPHYVWIGAVHAVLYGLEADRPEIVGEGVQGLGERLRALG